MLDIKLVKDKELDELWHIHADTQEDVENARPFGANLELWENSTMRFRKNDNSWWGIPGGSDAVAQVVKEGWAEGARKVEKVLGQIEPPRVLSSRRKKSRGPTGDEIDMQRVYAGSLDSAWSCMKREDGGRLRSPMSVTIVAHVGGNCHRDAEELFWSGACAVALARALRNSGRSCEIVGMFYTSNTTDEGKGICVEIPLQRMGAQTDLETLAGVLCLGGWFRNHGFKLMSMAPERVRSSYGRVVDRIPQCVKDKYTGAVIQITGVYDQESAKRFVQEETSKWR